MQPPGGVREWLGQGAGEVEETGLMDPLEHVARRQYHVPCNWKVFADNYLDGGYHVPFAHGALSDALDMSTYRSELFEKVSVQRCGPAAVGEGEAAGERLGGGRPAAYSFVFPNLMINRYGPWMDTNVVVPTGVDTCVVRFDYWLDPARAGDTLYIEESLRASDQVQAEDHKLCELVQGGLASNGYDVGRYAPGVEAPMHHFHRLYYEAMTGGGSHPDSDRI
mmetsp:Transcript_58579/g.186753  ORF Transcript_58579/g.186753 Transcript_58579/m.186753 type:complete len:222 (+) Transcript_58579:97-762(+)